MTLLKPPGVYWLVLAWMLSGFAVSADWLRRELARVEPWETALLCVSDACTVLMCLELALGGWRRVLPRGREPVPRRVRLTMALLGLTAILADFSGALLGFRSDARRRERALVLEGRLLDVRHPSSATELRISYRHPERGDVEVRDEFPLRDLERHLPPHVFGRIKGGKLPVALPIRVDRDRPDRFWLDYPGLGRANSILFWSLLMLLFQFIFWLFLFTAITYFAMDHLKLVVMVIQGFFLWFFFVVRAVATALS